MTRRAERVSHLIRQEISELLLENVNDPRLKSFISITEVSTSPDLKSAVVYISVMGGEDNAREAIKGFESASGYFRRELSRRLTIRHIPELSFKIDNSIERGVRLLNLIEQVSAQDSEDERRRNIERK